MPIRTRASYEEEATDWAAAADSAVFVPPPPPPPALNYDLPRQEESLEDEKEQEQRVNTGEDETADEVENDELILEHDSIEPDCRPTWILQVEISEGATNGDGENLGPAHVFIDPGMNAERLGRCIIQALSPTSVYSRDYNDDFTSSNHRSNMAGLFGKDDRVFYSLEFILAMDTEDGAKRTFCVTKPVRRKVSRSDQTDDVDRSSMISSYITSYNLVVATAILFGVIFSIPIVLNRFDSWNQFLYSIIVLIPHDLPSMWRIVSYVLDWPAREVYRYGPSIVGWEGRDLIDICTQMNRRYYFVGLGRDGHNYEDREYWRQNPEACETIYRMKEESFARMCRPFWYLTVLIVSFILIQQLVHNFIAKSPGRQLNHADRAVLDMYKALQILSREHRRQDDRLRQQQTTGRRQ